MCTFSWRATQRALSQRSSTASKAQAPASCGRSSGICARVSRHCGAAKDVNDAAWAQFVSMVRYKAECAGCEVVEVDPRGTSQMCPECGTVAEKTLAERTHRCDCGCVLDRDVAAAMVVHYRAFGFWPGAGLRTLSEPVAA